MQNYTIHIKNLLLLTLISIAVVYYIFLTPDLIVSIIKDQYIFIGIVVVLLFSLIYFKVKLKGLDIIEYLPNTDIVSLKSTIGFFLVFQVIDFYYEDGFIGMISQWIIYWIFGLLAWLLTNNINLYKNFQFYKYQSIKEHRL